MDGYFRLNQASRPTLVDDVGSEEHVGFGSCPSLW